MEPKDQKKSYWSLTAFLTVCAVLVFYDTVFQGGVLLALLRKLIGALAPVLYGAAMAYLLAPVVNFFDRCIDHGGRSGPRGLVRAGSILLTWAVVFFLLYVLFSILIPQLYLSVATLVGNMQGYYNTVYAWVMQLLERYPWLADAVADAIATYWDELRGWLTGTFLPQAQQTIMVLTSGLLSVLAFLKNLLVGVVVSVYLLALKERFALGARRLLYSYVKKDATYDLTLKAVAKADQIFSGFVRGKLLDSLIIGVLCFIGATLLKLPYTPLVSVIVGVTNIIPFFGPFIGAIPSAFLILLVSPVKCLYFVIFVIVLQQLDGNFIGPKILGGSTELPSFWVIVAILIGGGFFGVAGMFLGVPVFACLYAAVGYDSGKRLDNKKNVPEDLLPKQEAAAKDPQGGLK